MSKNDNSPTVSIVTISYNQEKFIAQALDSIMMQKTNYSFEIIIADDASTDKTPEIIESYANQHPDIIRFINRKSNIGAQNNLIDALQCARGQYIAMCEGDDFWIDELKLQKQIDFLSSNSEYSLCFHLVEVFYENNEKPKEIYPHKNNETEFNLEGLLEENFIQTNSVVYRKRDYTHIPSHILPLDWYLHLYHAQEGKIGFISEVMSAYRRHSGGIWWGSYRNLDEIWTRHGIAHYSMYCEISKLFNDEPKYQNIIHSHIYRTLGLLIDTDRKFHTKLVNNALDKYPNAIDPLTTILAKDVPELEAMVRHKDDQIVDLESRISHLNHELKEIKTSKSWRTVTLFKKYKSILAKILRR